MNARNTSLEEAAQECDILAVFAEKAFGEPDAAFRLRQAARNIRELMLADPHELAAAAIARARSAA